MYQFLQKHADLPTTKRPVHKQVSTEDKANAVYLQYLDELRRPGTKHVPSFTLTEGSWDPHRMRKSEWRDHAFELELDLDEEDLALFLNEQVSEEEIDNHLAFAVSEARRRAEVTIR